MTGGGGCGAEGDPYHVVVSLALLPRIQSAVSTGWVPREPEPLLACLDAWHPLLPPDLYRHVTESLVFPKVRLPPVAMYLYRLSDICACIVFFMLPTEWVQKLSEAGWGA